LEQDTTGKLHFRSNELSLRLTDRLRALNDDASFAEAKTEVEQLFGRVYGGTVSVERLAEPRGPLGLSVKTTAARSLEALLEKLVGPPAN
jgi:hypothetical protein